MKLKNWIISLVSALITILVLELILRFDYPSYDRYYVWEPNLNITLNPDPEILQGISGQSIFKTNKLGIRADELEGQEIQIITLGSSTTLAMMLDQNETWPHLLQENLQDSLKRVVWVGNMAKAGLNTHHTQKQTDLILTGADYAKVDLVIFSLGINDMLSFLRGEPQYTDPSTDDLNIRAFRIHDDRFRPFYKRTATWKLLISMYRKVFNKQIVTDRTGHQLRESRLDRQNSNLFIEELPPLQKGLAIYGQNIRNLISRSRELGFNILFLTQPSLWKEHCSPNEQSRMWSGFRLNEIGDGRHAYFTCKTLFDAMQAYNDLTIQVCQNEHVAVFDLATKIPKNLDYFYDDCHFTEAGAALAAREISEFLLDNPQLVNRSGN